jgi:hypothetical protein
VIGEQQFWRLVEVPSRAPAVKRGEKRGPRR